MQRNPFDSAVQKGRDAFLAGNPKSACPYRDKRKEDGRLTFGRAWRTAWHDGYNQALQEAVAAILSGKPASIGSSMIGMDGQYLCATDPYGCDRYFGYPTEENIRKALDWVIPVESTPVGEHPAERTASAVTA